MVSQLQCPNAISRQLQSARSALEPAISLIVLIAFIGACLSAASGHEKVDGQPSNGVRRAASQLERKFANCLLPVEFKTQTRIG